jgi:acyl-CoA reductase-like NAD-dependent aldehyde dehydrogenase
MIEAIGLPAGVFNLVSGPGSKGARRWPAPAGRHGVVHRLHRRGVRVAQAAAPSVKRVCLELGGKSPLLIAADADLAAAVRYGVQDVMINSGQTCTALTRMLLPASRYAEALERAGRDPEPAHGRPARSRSFLGPMCSAGQRRTVEDYIRLGQSEGARLLCGGDSAPASSAAITFADAVRRGRQPYAHRPGRNLRPGAVPDSLCG